MSFDKFIQTRTIARKTTIAVPLFPTYQLDSFIDFEADGYLVGIHFMLAHNLAGPNGNDADRPSGGIVAKVSGDQLNIPAGGNLTDFSGAQILISHLAFPDSDGTGTSLEQASRQTTIAYDADSKRIPIKSNDRLGVYLCSNATVGANFAYTLTAYFVRS